MHGRSCKPDLQAGTGFNIVRVRPHCGALNEDVMRRCVVSDGSMRVAAVAAAATFPFASDVQRAYWMDILPSAAGAHALLERGRLHLSILNPHQAELIPS